MSDIENLAPSGAEAILMNTYGISIQGRQFVFEQYRYDKLEDAIAYAKKNMGAEGVKRAAVRARSGHACIVLGGSGWNAIPKHVYTFQVDEESVSLLSNDSGQDISLSVEDLISIDISGPGTTSSNAGLVGGGFGLEGAALGMAAASLINAVTTRTSTNTFLRLASREAEVFLHFTDVEPLALRLYLSALVVRVEAIRCQNSAARVGLSGEIIALKALLDDGTLTAAEFAAAKAKVLG